ncbi:MAG: helix-turn-helix transcriptional regulator [Paludibacteraceae bacterium]|nr:helix-turn-helix transcriptional regulator [Paludibacteraceae bacterium]
MNTSQLISVLLVNLPAYVLGGIAFVKKIRDENYYAAWVFLTLLLVLVADAVFVSQMFFVETCLPVYMEVQAAMSVSIVPLLYMFLSPEGGEERWSRTTIILWLLTLLILLPSVSWEVVPAYAITQYFPPREIMGISIFYKGRYVYFLGWTAIALTLQSFVALSQLKRLYKAVSSHGAHYSWKAKATYYWDFSCGYWLSLSFLVPLHIWQTPAMRWVFYVSACVIIAVGCLLLVLGFDINPVVDNEHKKQTLHDFMLENGEIVERMKRLLEEDRIYLEHGIQSDTVAERLDTSHAYFLRMMRIVYDMSFPEWVNRARVEYAKQLLSDPDIKTEQVAAECGYKDAYTLAHMFHQITGTTISEWRNGKGEQEDFVETASPEMDDD